MGERAWLRGFVRGRKSLAARLSTWEKEPGCEALYMGERARLFIRGRKSLAVRLCMWEKEPGCEALYVGERAERGMSLMRCFTGMVWSWFWRSMWSNSSSILRNWAWVRGVRRNCCGRRERGRGEGEGLGPHCTNLGIQEPASKQNMLMKAPPSPFQNLTLYSRGGHVIHTYIHTYMYTYIHTYIHTVDREIFAVQKFFASCLGGEN